MAVQLKELVDRDGARSSNLVVPLPDELAPLVVEYYGTLRLRLFGDASGAREARELAERIREQRLDMPPDLP